MKKHILILIACQAIAVVHATAQATAIKPDITEDTGIGMKPTAKVENISPDGHCNNLQLDFYAPWADHYEIAKRRCDTAWINNFKPVNSWSFQSLKPGVNSVIYKSLDEKGAFQFVVKAIKGTRYRNSDTITRKPCDGANSDK